jgi:hypothetical protein
MDEKEREKKKKKAESAKKRYQKKDEYKHNIRTLKNSDSEDDRSTAMPASKRSRLEKKNERFTGQSSKEASTSQGF